MNLKALNLLLAQTLWATPIAGALVLVLVSQLPNTGLNVNAAALVSSAIGFVLAGVVVSLYWKGVDINSALTKGARSRQGYGGHGSIALGNATVLFGIIPLMMMPGEEYAVVGGMAVMIGTPIAVLFWIFGWRQLGHS
jgi:hypothetical protein